MNEIWKDIEGYNGLYRISDLGRVKSLEGEFDSTTRAARFLAPVLRKDIEKIKKAINNQLRKYPNGKSCGFNWRYKL